MGQIETVVNYTKKIETIFVNELGATGRGLHEKLDSIGNVIDSSIARKIRYIASARNKLMHEDGYEIDDMDRFILNAEQVIDYLNELKTIMSERNENKDIEEFLNTDYSDIPYLFKRKKTISNIISKLILWLLYSFILTILLLGGSTSMESFYSLFKIILSIVFLRFLYFIYELGMIIGFYKTAIHLFAVSVILFCFIYLLMFIEKIMGFEYALLFLALILLLDVTIFSRLKHFYQYWIVSRY